MKQIFNISNKLKFPDYKQIIGLHQLSSPQKLLLQASVLKGEAALDAWQQWQSMVDIDTLDTGSNALLSQLYSNLAAHQVEHTYMSRLKGIYKRSWYGNQLLLKKLQTVLKALESAQIKAVILGDVATVLGYYQEHLQHPIYYFNLLIHPTEEEKAIAILAQQGWHQLEQNMDNNQAGFSAQLEDHTATRLHLQGQVFWAAPQEQITQQLWTNTVSCRLGDLEVSTLKFTDLLLHLCLKAFYLSQTPQIILFADAMTLLQRHQAEIDWFELVTEAQKYQVILPLRNMLTVLQELFAISLPDWVLSALHQMPVGQKEFLTYQVLPQRKRTIIKSILFRTAKASQLITR